MHLIAECTHILNVSGFLSMLTIASYLAGVVTLSVICGHNYF